MSKTAIIMKVGQRLWLKTWHRGKSDILEVEIATIGKEYFTLFGDSRSKYRLSDMKKESEYNWGYNFFFTYQECLDDDEFNELLQRIRKYFDYYNSVTISLDDLRIIDSIINKPL